MGNSFIVISLHTYTTKSSQGQPCSKDGQLSECAQDLCA